MTDRNPLYLNNGVTTQMGAGDTIDPSLLPSTDVAWGDITGTLSDQTDLQGALDNKYNASNPSGFISNISGFTTSDLAEGTNLYFTDERAQDAVGNAVGTSLSYNDTTGAIDAIQDIRTTASPTFNELTTSSTYNIFVSGTVNKIFNDFNYTVSSAIGSGGTINAYGLSSTMTSNAAVAGGPTNQNTYAGYYLNQTGGSSGITNNNFYGLYGEVNSSSTTGTINNYGVYGNAVGTTGGASTSHGVFGNATGADTNWAGFFNQGNVGINGDIILSPSSEWPIESKAIFEYGQDSGFFEDGTPIGLYWSDYDIGSGRFELRTRGGTFQAFQASALYSSFISNTGALINSGAITCSSTFANTLSHSTANSNNIHADTITFNLTSNDTSGSPNRGGVRTSVNDTGNYNPNTSGQTRQTYGDFVSVNSTGTTGTGSPHTRNTYGYIGLVSNTGAVTSGTGLRNTYGGFFSATGDANGSSVAYGVYGAALGADNNWAGYFVGDSNTTGNFAVGVSATTALDAKATILQDNIGSPVTLTQSSTASGVPVQRYELQGQIEVTNATTTTVVTLPTSAGTTYFIEATVAARRTGGAAGVDGDSAGYKMFATFRTNSGGTLVQVGTTTNTATHESQAAWAATIVASGTNILLRFAGAASNNVRVNGIMNYLITR
jgi:hypothetical protein